MTAPSPVILTGPQVDALAEEAGAPRFIGRALIATAGTYGQNIWGPDPFGSLRECAGYPNAPVVGEAVTERSWNTYVDRVLMRRLQPVPVGPAVLTGNARLADLHKAGGRAWDAAESTGYALGLLQAAHVSRGESVDLRTPESWWFPAQVYFDSPAAADRFVDAVTASVR